MTTRFQNRAEAGRVLAGELRRFANRDDVVVYALPRGGVPVAYEVAKALHVPLDVLLVRKLGVPEHEELAFGAIAGGGIRVLNEGLMAELNLSEGAVQEIIDRETTEIERRRNLYVGRRRAFDPAGQLVIIVDDGLATGSTMEAAVNAIKVRGPKEVVVAAPVASRSTFNYFNRRQGVSCVCADVPEPFYSVGLFYRDYSQTTDEEVSLLLKRAEAEFLDWTGLRKSE